MLNYIPTTQSGGNLPTVLKSLSGQQPWHTSSMLTAPPPKSNNQDDSSPSNSNLSKNLNSQSTSGSWSPDNTPTGFAPTDAELSGGITGTGLDASAADAGGVGGIGAGIGDLGGAGAGIGDVGAGIGGAGMGADALGAGGAMDFGWLAALFA